MELPPSSRPTSSRVVFAHKQQQKFEEKKRPILALKKKIQPEQAVEHKAPLKNKEPAKKH